MSIQDVEVPTVGESITSGVLVEWKRESGKVVAIDEPLFVLETDKITMEITASAGGKLETLVEAGAEVTIGQVVARIDTSVTAPVGPAGAAAAASDGAGDRDVAQAAVSAVSEAAAPGAAEQGVPQGDGVRVNPPAGIPQAKEKIAAMEKLKITPVAQKMVDEHGLDPSEIPAIKDHGRLTKSDVLSFLESRAQGAGKASATPASEPALPAATASSAAAAVAAVVAADGHAPARQGNGPAAVTATPVAAAAPGERQTRKPMTRLRQRIAERLVQAQQTAAMLTTFNEVDMSAVIAWRQELQEEFVAQHGIKLGFMSFFVRAVVKALEAMPQIKSFIEGEEIVENHYFDIGVAVSTEQGLVVPVLRDANRIGFAGIEKQIAELAEKARKRTLTLDELTGGVFTVSNGGIYGNLLSTPILNPPQSAILGMHTIKKRPVVVDDEIVIRPMMYLAVSYDHRLVDGREAVTFLKHIVASIEDPRRMLVVD